MLAPGGRAVITHPLGAAFVDELHERDASVVPAGLPRTLLDMEELVEGTALTPAFVAGLPHTGAGLFDAALARLDGACGGAARCVCAAVHASPGQDTEA